MSGTLHLIKNNKVLKIINLGFYHSKNFQKKNIIIFFYFKISQLFLMIREDLVSKINKENR